jgi:phosphomannomutase
VSEAAAIYQCPGERHPISRSVHWGRLASFHPACRTCPHRDDTGPLSARQVEKLAETRLRAAASDLFFDEGLAGVEYNELTPAVARRAAFALAAHLQTDIAEPTVAVAGDGRALAIELLAAAAEGLRFAGCRVVDLGAATAPVLAAGVASLGADGGLLVGNDAGKPHTASLKFWGAGGAPLSRGAGLEAVAEQYAQNAGRGGAAYGGLRRHQAEEAYLVALQPLFHALRPLRIVLDTSCRPLKAQLERLTRQVACEFLPPSHAPQAAHARMWIDGDGERLKLWDERGEPVEPTALLVAFAEHLADESALPKPLRVVVEETAFAEADARLACRGVQLVCCPATRAGAWRAMRATDAHLGGGPSGRFWFGPDAADALHALARLLVLLSSSDRPLSAVAAETIKKRSAISDQRSAFSDQ